MIQKVVRILRLTKEIFINMLNLIKNKYFKKFDLYIKNKNFREHIYDNSSEFQNLLNKDLKKTLSLEFYEKNLMLNHY